MKFSVFLHSLSVHDLLVAGSGWEQCLSKPDISQQCVTWWLGDHEAARRRMCGVRK